ncbi:hypothetical protein RclHR1_05530009 [Rhizophagus clarus]|uniref:Uncharacterized protein n=1 Tax=Rhizophagus clarus TaxID=94130 RepID=A0A2Z6S4S0_9GLOM|nr:hypothetical protein RclHR1_05530009 [Rhizophagus clarus]
MFDQRKIYLDSVTVLFVRDYICEKKKVIDFDNMKLWKLKEVKHRNIKNQNISTEEDIVQKLKGEEMELTELFEVYIRGELDDPHFVATNIHIISIIPTISTIDKYLGRKRPFTEEVITSWQYIVHGPLEIYTVLTVKEQLEKEGYVCIYITLELIDTSSVKEFWSSIGIYLARDAHHHIKNNSEFAVLLEADCIESSDDSLICL